MTAVEFVQRYIFPLILIGYSVIMLVIEWPVSSRWWSWFFAIGFGIILLVIGLSFELGNDRKEREGLSEYQGDSGQFKGSQEDDEF